MNSTWHPVGSALIVGLTLGLAVATQAQAPGLSQPKNVTIIQSSGGYSAGGERGSVFRIIGHPAVQDELQLTAAQQQHIIDIRRRVARMERTHLNNSAQMRHRATESRRVRQQEQQMLVDRANEQLASATARVLALLTPTQQNRLDALCRQAEANEAEFLAQMAPGRDATRRTFNIDASGGTARGGASGGGLDRPSPAQSLPTVHPPQPARPQAVTPPARRPSGASGGGAVGGGGFGDGLAGGAPSQHTSSSTEYASGGGPGGLVRVISYPRVQDDLQLTVQQQRHLAEILAEVSRVEADLAAEVMRPNPTFDHSSREWLARSEEAARDAVAQADAELLGELTPAQRKRIEEICLQVEGAEGLFRPRIIQALGLTATQQARLASLRQERERKTNELLFPEHRGRMQLPTSADLTGRHQRAAALAQQYEARMITTVLTPEQQDQFRQLQGTRFAGLDRIAGAGSGTARGQTGTGYSVTR